MLLFGLTTVFVVSYFYSESRIAAFHFRLRDVASCYSFAIKSKITRVHLDDFLKASKRSPWFSDIVYDNCSAFYQIVSSNNGYNVHFYTGRFFKPVSVDGFSKDLSRSNEGYEVYSNVSPEKTAELIFAAMAPQNDESCRDIRARIQPEEYQGGADYECRFKLNGEKHSVEFVDLDFYDGIVE